jgi:hypothetical protein
MHDGKKAGIFIFPSVRLVLKIDTNPTRNAQKCDNVIMAFIQLNNIIKVVVFTSTILLHTNYALEFNSIGLNMKIIVK